MTALVALLGAASPAASQAATRPPPVTLTSYARSDGAITVFPNGSYVEPYFAMRALNSAADLGGDVDSVARAYVAWQLQRLDTDSTFKRYCLGADSTWTACGAPDADDAALALWIELLYRTAGRSLPVEWKRSVDAARRGLASLLDPRTRVYHVSRETPVALFMDNIEVLSALETAARTASARRAGDRLPLSRGAARLRAAIRRVFWDPVARGFAVSTQRPAREARFYPEIVAQVFPAIFRYGSPVHSPEALTAQWLRLYEDDWIAESDRGAAWGLIAVAAARNGQAAALERWLERARRGRAVGHWNVADEAIYLAMTGGTTDQRIR
jgi:hypothetical protein